MEKNYEFLEHTADIAIRIKGKTLKSLFENAAAAVFDIIAERQKKGGKKVSLTIVQESQNHDELFVNWLNELLSLSSAKGFVFTGFKIAEVQDHLLKAIVTGEDIKNFRINTEIKAATYHGLKLERKYSGWTAQIIFDV